MAGYFPPEVGAYSPEYVAFKLLQSIGLAENKRVAGTTSEAQWADRKWLLDTYAECLRAVRMPDKRQ